MGQIATCQYICSVINAKPGAVTYMVNPVPGTGSQLANCEYLLRMIDKANGSATSFGTGSYATTQLVDREAVNDAVNRLYVTEARFVAVASDTNQAVFSTDGITWAYSNLPSVATWFSVTYGNGRFVAVASGSNQVAFSTDGIHWTASTLPSAATWSSVTYGNGRFVTVAGTNQAAFSTDGIYWTASTLPSVFGSYQWTAVTYGNGRFVAVSRACSHYEKGYKYRQEK